MNLHSPGELAAHKQQLTVQQEYLAAQRIELEARTESLAAHQQQLTAQQDYLEAQRVEIAARGEALAASGAQQEQLAGQAQALPTARAQLPAAPPADGPGMQAMGGPPDATGAAWAGRDDGEIEWGLVVDWLVHEMAQHTDYSAFFASYLFEEHHHVWTGLVTGGAPAVASVHSHIRRLHAWERANVKEKLRTYAAALVSGAAQPAGDFSTGQNVFELQKGAQVLYYERYFNSFGQWQGAGGGDTGQGQCPWATSHSSMQEQHVCHQQVSAQLAPNIAGFIQGGLARAAERPASDQPSKVSLVLAVVNTLTLFGRVLGLVDQRGLSFSLALLQRGCGAENHGELNMYSKIVVLAHVGLNIKGQCHFDDVAWIFQYFDDIEGELLAAFDDVANPNRDIILDLVAEVCTCYYYSNHCTDSLSRYLLFVKREVRRKYSAGFASSQQGQSTYYAHADLASAHEAVSLYHLFMVQVVTEGRAH